MAEPEVTDVAKWLIDNPDKEGTPDYVKMTSAYKMLREGGTAAATQPTKDRSWGALWNDIKLAGGGDSDPRSGGERLASWWRGDEEQIPPTPPDPNAPNGAFDIGDIMAAQRLTSDPNSFANIGRRQLATKIGGIPDVGIGLWNAGARAVGSPESQADYLTPKLLENSGTAPMPADAPWWQQLGESGLSALLGGGANAAGSVVAAARNTAATTGQAIPRIATTLRAAAPTVLPTLAGHYGGEGAGAIGDQLGLDPETTRLLGSLLSSTAVSAAPAARSIVHRRYEGRGAPDAAALAAEARNQGVTPTAGMLGNESILRREQALSGQGGSANVIQGARTAAREGIGAAADRSAAARGSTNAAPTEGTIGYDVANIARQGVDAANARSSAGQQQLMTRIGPRADMDVGPVEQRILALRGETDPLTAAPLESRLTSLQTMIARNPANFDAEGNRIASNIPYQQGKDFRTNLRESGEGYRPVTGHHADTVYDLTTDQMRGTATNQGVPAGYFDTVQGRTAALTGEGGPVQTLEPISNPHQPMPAYNFVRSGEQAPTNLRVLEATGNPDVGRALGDYMRLISNNTINSPAGGARGPINFAEHWTGMAPEARQAIAGPELRNVGEQVRLAQALNIPPSQNGLTRALGGQGEGVGRMVMGQEMMGRAGGAVAGWPGEVAGRLAGILGLPAVRSVLANILEGPTVRRALTGAPDRGGIEQLGAALSATAAQQQQRDPTVP